MFTFLTEKIIGPGPKTLKMQSFREEKWIYNQFSPKCTKIWTLRLPYTNFHLKPDDWWLTEPVKGNVKLNLLWKFHAKPLYASLHRTRRVLSIPFFIRIYIPSNKIHSRLIFDLILLSLYLVLVRQLEKKYLFFASFRRTIEREQ